MPKKKHFTRILSLVLVAILLILLAVYHDQITTFFTKADSIPVVTTATPIHKPVNNEKALLYINGCTIQLLGVSNFKNLINFVTANKLEDNTYIFHSINNNKDWYTLIYGNYKTHEQAKAAEKHLPETIKKLHPWIRSMDSVHSVILQSKQ